jgi:5-methylcytosine-specific restriction endonuclease McrA
MYATFRAEWHPPNDDGPLPRLGGMTDVSRIEPLYSRVVTAVAGRSAEVRCWSYEDWATRSKEVAAWTNGKSRPGPWSAYVSYDRERANLPPATCHALGQWAYERRWPDNRWDGYHLAWSVRSLAHEAQHVHGIEDEAKAECYGLQSIRAAASGLGLDDERAQFLAEYAWRYIYPELSAAYRSDECRDGGELDLRPGTSVWP